jgi:hypothetical protein
MQLNQQIFDAANALIALPCGFGLSGFHIRRAIVERSERMVRDLCLAAAFALGSFMPTVRLGLISTALPESVVMLLFIAWGLLMFASCAWWGRTGYERNPIVRELLKVERTGWFGPRHAPLYNGAAAIGLIAAVVTLIR